MYSTISCSENSYIIKSVTEIYWILSTNNNIIITLIGCPEPLKEGDRMSNQMHLWSRKHQKLERKIILKFCTMHDCDGVVCYCCDNQQDYCYGTKDQCKANCKPCNPKCPQQQFNHTMTMVEQPSRTSVNCTFVSGAWSALIFQFWLSIAIIQDKIQLVMLLLVR